jgi:hypothetical protein
VTFAALIMGAVVVVLWPSFLVELFGRRSS